MTPTPCRRCGRPSDHACTTLDTTYGTLLVSCANPRSLYISADGSTKTASEFVVLSRVRYLLRLPLEAVGSGQRTPMAVVPALEDTEWRVADAGLRFALARSHWTDFRRSGPTEAAQRELVERLIPEVAEWLTTDAARALVAEGEARDLAAVAGRARERANALRAAAHELEQVAAAAERGDDLSDDVRISVRAGSVEEIRRLSDRPAGGAA